ncbi:MAG: ABC transporter ATP-binding protein, partial [Bryobacteraceae bacterium]
CCTQVLILKDGQIAASCDLEEERRANRRFLELETQGADSSFAEAIERMGCQTAVTGQGRLKLVMPAGLEIRQLYALAAERQVQIRRLDHKRDSLEEIFLKAMENGHGRL